MRTSVLYATPFLLIGLLISPQVLVHASSSSPDCVHFCAFDDYERLRRDHPRPAAKRPADLNVGKPRTVRMIYFLPNDRPYRAEVVHWMKEDIREVQTFFAEQMQAHGYGNKTFRFETDVQGEPLVHRVDAQHPESHYYSTDEVWQYWHFDELGQTFDFYQNIYVIYSDSDLSWGGAITGGRTWKESGFVDFRRGEREEDWPDWGVLSHELGHAFGLGHDFRDGAYLMSYGGPSQFPNAVYGERISACAGEFLSVHPYFNSAIPIEDLSPPTIERRFGNHPPFPIEDLSPPTIELISPNEYPAGSRSVSIKFEVSDSDGLHQVSFYSIPGIGGAYFTGGLRECRALEGRRDAVVEFDYDGSTMAADPWRYISSLFQPVHFVEVRAVDKHGNVSRLNFDLVADRVADVLNGHTDSVNAVVFSPDRTTLASGSSDGTVKLWDVSRRELLATLEGHGDRVMAVAFSHDGTLASGSLNGIKLWDVATRNETATLQGIAPVAFSPDGTLLASGSGNRTIALWDASTLKRVSTLEGHAEQINTVAFSPDSRTLASGSSDGTVKLWDVAGSVETATVEYRGAIWSVAFSSVGGTLALAVGSPDNAVRLWHARRRTEVARLWHEGPVLSLSYSPGGELVASGSGDGKVRLWDAMTREHLGTFLPVQPRRPSESGVRSLAFSPDGTTLAAGTEYHTIELRDVSKWKRPPFPFGLEIISGDGQQGAPGAALASPLVV